MTVLALCTLIQFSKGQTSADRCPQGRTCLNPAEMDYFLRRDAKCHKLEIDSVEMAGKIKEYKENESLYKANETDYKSQISVNKTLADNYKTTAADFQFKYLKQKDKANFRGKVLIGSLVLNLAFIAGIVISLK